MAGWDVMRLGCRLKKKLVGHSATRVVLQWSHKSLVLDEFQHEWSESVSCMHRLYVLHAPKASIMQKRFINATDLQLDLRTALG